MSRFNDNRGFGLLYAFLGICQLSFAIAILAIVASDLWHVTAYPAIYVNGYYVYRPVWGTCWMQTSFTNDTDSICWYSYWVAGIGVIAGCVTVVLQFVRLCDGARRNACSIGCSIFMWIWWVVAASIITAAGHHADENNIPQEKYRHYIVAFSWTEVLFFTLALLLDVFEAMRPSVASGKDYPNAQPADLAHYPPSDAEKQTEMAGGYPPAPAV